MSSTNEILSIDDSKAVHAFLDRCVEGTNIKFTHAMGVKEGLEKIKLDPKLFTLILLDWEMPEISGPEALDIFNKEGITIPVIMLTSKSNLTEISAMLEKGAKEYVLKPFTPDIILEKIQSVIGSSS